jgi:hypothetical protein
MTRRAYLYFVITFLIGIVVGGAGVYYYAWSAGKWRHAWNEDAFIHYWTKQLNLSPSQETRCRSITDETIKRHAAIDRQHNLQVEALRNDWRTRIRQILNPQQATTFNQINLRHDEAHKKR